MANKNKKTPNSAAAMAAAERQYMIGPGMNFAAAEAYKLLRTNVMFSFSDTKQAHVLGITSSFRSEGKSLTAINLACAFAEADKDVLLIEADMRLPTMANRLGLAVKPGLSNILVGTDSVSMSVQEYAMQARERTVCFDVLVSGDVPPIPSELLGSARMAAFLKKAGEEYDYIILDLPPVTAVSDAIIASHLVDGMVVVVRAEYASRGALAEAMRQLSMAGAHVMGFVFNGAASGEGRYYKKRYYKKGYYKRGYYASERYGYGGQDTGGR